MKKILYSDMNKLGDLLDSYVQKDNIALRNAMKNATLFKFWGKVVGKKFENVSKPVSITQRPDKTILNVACANSAVTGELTMFKLQLVKKINDYANPIGINIDDMNFSHKIWQTENPKTYENNAKILEENPYKEDLTGFNPNEIELSEQEISNIRNNVSHNKALTEQQKERLLSSIIYDIKVHKFLDKSL